MKKPNSPINKAILDAVEKGKIGLIDVIQIAHDKLANTLLSQVDVRDFPFVEKMRRPQSPYDMDRLNDVDFHLKSIKLFNGNNYPKNSIVTINEKQYIKQDNDKIFEVHSQDEHIIALYNPIRKEFCIVENKAPYRVLLESVKYVEQTKLDNLYVVTFHTFSSLHTTMLDLEGGFNHEMVFQAMGDGKFIPRSKLFVSTSKIYNVGNVIYFHSDSLDFKQSSLTIISKEKTLEIERFGGDTFQLKAGNGRNFLIWVNYSGNNTKFSLFNADTQKMILEDVESIQLKGVIYDKHLDSLKQVEINFDSTTRDYFKSIGNNNITLVIDNNITYTQSHNRSDKLPFLGKKIDKYEVDLYQE